MHQLPGFARVMAIDRIEAIARIVNTAYDELEEMEHQCYHMKMELSAAIRYLKGVQRTLDDYQQD